jgi:hypothetical protein
MGKEDDHNNYDIVNIGSAGRATPSGTMNYQTDLETPSIQHV